MPFSTDSDTNHARRVLTRLREKVAEKKLNAEGLTEFTLSITPNTNYEFASGELCQVKCHLHDAKTGEILERDQLMRLMNITDQILDTKDMPDDHELKLSPPRRATIQVALMADVDKRFTLAAKVKLEPDVKVDEPPIFAGPAGKDRLISFQLPELSFYEWRRKIAIDHNAREAEEAIEEEKIEEEAEDSEEEEEDFEDIVEGVSDLHVSSQPEAPPGGAML